MMTPPALVESKAWCTGCTACCEICPKGAIEMAADKEGFYYPAIDGALCVSCRMCVDVCPVRARTKEGRQCQSG